MKDEKLVVSDLVPLEVSKAHLKDLEKLKDFITNYDKDEVTEVTKEIQDLFELYLDTDLAGDNDDRRNKLKSINVIKELTSLILSTQKKLEFE